MNLIYLTLLYCMTSFYVKACSPDGYFQLTLCRNSYFNNCEVIETHTGCCYSMPAPYVTSLNSAKAWLDTCTFYTGANCDGAGQCIDTEGYRDMSRLPAYRSYFCRNGGASHC
ncbi:hypothetical protein BJ944DRAFT_272375 [Cunninghamella echinulata]|nr:hypothetical protein BJ944DRAFT_272375 [Cunninghamella echinulata]